MTASAFRVLGTVALCGLAVSLSACGHHGGPTAPRVSQLLGETSDDGGTASLAAADLDGDGRDDLILSTAYGLRVIPGRARFPRLVKISRLRGSYEIRIRHRPVVPRCCTKTPDELLNPVADLGDLNGDGREDLGIGGYGYDPELARAYGSLPTPTAQAYVLFGARRTKELDLTRAGDAVATVATGLSSDASGRVELRRLPGHRLLAIATQSHLYPNQCGRGSHPLPVITTSLSATLPVPARGARIDLSHPPAAARRLGVPGRGNAIDQVIPVLGGLRVAGERSDSINCFRPPSFTRDGSVAAFEHGGRDTHSVAPDLRAAPAVGDFDADGRPDSAAVVAPLGHDYEAVEQRLVIHSATRNLTLPLGSFAGESDNAAVLVGDIDGDGTDEFAIVGDDRTTIVYGARRGGGTPRCRSMSTGNNLSSTPALGADLDGDGATDLVLVNEGLSAATARITFGPLLPSGHLRNSAGIGTQVSAAEKRNVIADPALCDDRSVRK